jgi:hypothetical protein
MPTPRLLRIGLLLMLRGRHPTEGASITPWELGDVIDDAEDEER